MKTLVFMIFLVISSFVPVVESGEIEKDDDYIGIFHVPSRGAFYGGEPTIDMYADTLSQNNNEELKSFYLRAKAITNYPELKTRTHKLNTQTMVDNSTTFHIASTRIEVGNKGDIISLAYSGKSNDPQYQRYEHEWLVLYKDILNYLINKISIR